MCIGILTSPGKIVSEEVFDRCWKNNPDGFGIAWINVNSGTVEIDKGWMAKSGAKNRYYRVADEAKNADRYMLLHFRAATVGRVEGSNCHPFKVKGGAMIHNGTFWRDSRALKSDSQMLAEMMFNELHYGNLSTNKEQFQEAFGYNRVAFLFKDNKPVIFSEEYDANSGKFGQWRDGIWYSNGGWHGAYGSFYGDGITLNDAADPLADDADYEAWLAGGGWLGHGSNYRIG